MTRPNERKPRISRRVRTAIEAMVFDGLSRAEAAKRTGCSDNWIYQQLRRPEVLALRNEHMKVLRESEAVRSITRIADLADGAASESVRFQANVYLLDLEQQGVAAKTNGNPLIGSVNLPGLTIVYQGQSDQPSDVIDTEVLDDLHPALNDE